MKRLLLAFILVTFSTLIEARTWRVNTAGTGDAPTLYAAMDSAAAFDTVLVEAGQYQLGSALQVPSNVRLVGESGAAQTLLFRDDYLAPATVSLLGNARISGIHVRGNTLPVLFLHGGAVFHSIVEAEINQTIVQGIGNPISFENCLLIGGDVAHPATFTSCIIMSDLGSYAVGSTLYVNDVLGSVHPDIDASSSNLNFSLDPQFCGVPGSGNYFLQSTSPCLPENNPYGAPQLIGPLPLGCGAVRVETRTWGSIKAMYR
jgi:hypothetical protein